MSVDRRLLEIICCPITHVALESAPRARLHMLNLQIAERRITSRGGRTLEQPLEDALMTVDGRLMYPVADGILLLLEDEAIHLSQLDGIDAGA